MNIITNILVFTLFVSYVSASRSASPLIKNIYRGGEHFEGPHWSSEENALYWVDISQQNVHRLDVNSGNVTTRHICYGPVSLVVTVKDNPKLVLVTSRAEVYLMPWDAPKATASLRLLSVVDLGKPDNRCNDGKVDANGRLWFGVLCWMPTGWVPTVPDILRQHKCAGEGYWSQIKSH